MAASTKKPAPKPPRTLATAERQLKKAKEKYRTASTNLNRASGHVTRLKTKSAMCGSGGGRKPAAKPSS